MSVRGMWFVLMTTRAGGRPLPLRDSNGVRFFLTYESADAHAVKVGAKYWQVFQWRAT